MWECVRMSQVGEWWNDEEIFGESFGENLHSGVTTEFSWFVVLDLRLLSAPFCLTRGENNISEKFSVTIANR